MTFRWQMRLTFVESLAPFGKDSSGLKGMGLKACIMDP